MSSARLKVVSLESRQAPEMLRLLERHGCDALSAPSMREIPLSDQAEVLAFGERLLSAACDVVVLLTGVGTRMMVDVLSAGHPREEIIAALARCQLVCRGPKPVAVLKGWGIRPKLVAPEPNTWQDLLTLLDAELPVSGRDVVVQAYGRVNEPLLAALRARGAKLHSVAIYAWAMPTDLAPLGAAIENICERRVDVVMFTSAQQLEHLFQLAERLGRAAALRDALLEHVLCASVGPIASEALRARGLPVDLMPEHPKMGHLVSAIARQAAELVVAKRAVV
jgi:uroporphyrinogen-III synthase